MAILHRFLSLLLLLIFFTTVTLHQTSASTFDVLELINLDDLPSTSLKTVHDLLPEFGFPKGLLPDAVKSYSLSDNGDFEVELERPCYVHFDDLVYYDKKINGKLKYGSISDVSGIQAKKAFLWVPITGIQADSNSGFIKFHVGFLSEKLPAEQFESIPVCQSKSCANSSPAQKVGGLSETFQGRVEIIPLVEVEKESVFMETQERNATSLEEEQGEVVAISLGEGEPKISEVVSEAKLEALHEGGVRGFETQLQYSRALRIHAL